MRVVHVVTRIGTYGGERFVPALVRAQRAAGLDASIVTLYGSPGDDAGVPVVSARRGETPGFFLRLVRTIRKLRPDIVHTHLAHAKHWGRLGAVLAGVPCVIHTEHANEFNDSLVKRWLTRMLHRRTSFVTAFTQAQADRIVTYEGIPRSRVVVIPSGIETAVGNVAQSVSRTALRREIGLSPGDRMVLAIGRLEEVKGYDLAIAALALLPSSYHLAIAGDGTSRSALEAQADVTGVRDRLHLLGYRSDVPALLAATDLVLNTSRSEASPLSLMEALHAGVPIVATPWPGASELLDESCIVREATAAATAASIEAAVQRPRPAPPANRKHLSIDVTAQRYARLYESAGKRSHRPEQPAPIPIALE